MWIQLAIDVISATLIQLDSVHFDWNSTSTRRILSHHKGCHFPGIGNTHMFSFKLHFPIIVRRHISFNAGRVEPERNMPAVVELWSLSWTSHILHWSSTAASNREIMSCPCLGGLAGRSTQSTAAGVAMVSAVLRRDHVVKSNFWISGRIHRIYVGWDNTTHPWSMEAGQAASCLPYLPKHILHQSH